MTSKAKLRHIARYHEQRGAALAEMLTKMPASKQRDEMLREAADHFTVAKGLYDLTARSLDLGPPTYDTGSSSRPQSQDHFGTPGRESI